MAALKASGDEVKALDAAAPRDRDRARASWRSALPNFPARRAARRRRVGQPGACARWGEPPALRLRAAGRTGSWARRWACSICRAGAKLTGSGFPLFRGMGARLVRALADFMLDLHTREHGYVEIAPPYLVNRATLTGTGQLPKFEEDLYGIAGRRSVPHSHRRGAGHQPPPRRDSRRRRAPARLRRLHALLPARGGCARQGHPRADPGPPVRQGRAGAVRAARRSRDAEHERMTGHAETVLQRLELPYRVVELAAGDTGFASARTYDLEVWAAGVGRLARGVELEHVHRLPGPPGEHPLSGPSPGPSPSSCTRSTRRASPSRAPSSPSWRTTRRPTGRCGCRRRWCRTSASTAWLRVPKERLQRARAHASRWCSWPLLAGLSLGTGLLDHPPLQGRRAPRPAGSTPACSAGSTTRDPGPRRRRCSVWVSRSGARPAAGGHRPHRPGDRRGEPSVRGPARRPAGAAYARRLDRQNPPIVDAAIGTVHYGPLPAQRNSRRSRSSRRSPSP